EVDHTLVALEGARRLDAPRVGFALDTDELGGEWARADLGELPRLESRRSQRQHGPDDLGDHVARLADDDRVAGAHVLRPHLILVVQRGDAYRRPTDEHRVEHRE